MIEAEYKMLSKAEKKLLKAAENALKNAYNPYGCNLVGAAVESKGKTFQGSSFACQSSGSNICAERAAVMNAVSHGFKNIPRMAIIGKECKKAIEEPLMPCGICLQFLEEVDKINGSKELEIISANTKKTKIYKTKLSELLPFPYNGSNGRKNNALVSKKKANKH